MTPEDFKKLIKQQCSDNGITCLLPDTQYVYLNGLQVSGYFGAEMEPATLACAVGKPDAEWLEILVHESCHLDQWLSNSPGWAAMRPGYDDTAVEDWLNREVEYDDKQVTELLKTVQEMELECEKLSLDKIIRLQLPIDHTMYVRRANAYMVFYWILQQTRQWCDVPPYRVPEIVEQMPDTWQTTGTYKQLAISLYPLYKDKCYNNSPLDKETHNQQVSL